MGIVKSVSYKVRINGRVSCTFLPQRVIRQVDPLSPYLFILCAEWLSISIFHANASRLIKGINIGHSAPSCTHMFYALDIILFFKVHEDVARHIKHMLSRYESISGQKVNYNKSDLVISRNCDPICFNMCKIFLVFLWVVVLLSAWTSHYCCND